MYIIEYNDANKIVIADAYRNEFGRYIFHVFSFNATIRERDWLRINATIKQITNEFKESDLAFSSKL